ncbi:MAG: germination protein YpeB, partial [Clostridia bacterium]|nr:germination protein YpeB [Clostridia bacterium]
MTVKRRMFIRVISYLVAVCVVFAAAGLFSQRAKAGYEETLGKVRMTNLGTLSEHFRDISAGLRLLAVSTESSFSDSSSYVEARVMGAKGCLNGFNAKKVKNISDCLDTVNKFTQSFTGSSEKRKIAIYLSEYARDVYYHLNDVSSAILNGAYSLTEYGSIYIDDGKPYFEDFVDYSNGSEKELFGAAAPASANAEGIFFGDKISEEMAADIAGDATGINPALWRKNKDNSDVYSFRHGDTLVNVAKSGMVCKLINPKPCRTAKISVEEAEKKAAEYLAEFGYKNLSALRREKSEFTAS